MANIEVPVFGTGLLISGIIIIVVSMASMLVTAPFPLPWMPLPNPRDSS